LQYFLSTEALSNSSKVQLSQKRKNIRSKSAKKWFFEIFSKNFFFPEWLFAIFNFFS
jgi:hypothetical protein